MGRSKVNEGAVAGEPVSFFLSWVSKTQPNHWTVLSKGRTPVLENFSFFFFLFPFFLRRFQKDLA